MMKNILLKFKKLSFLKLYFFYFIFNILKKIIYFLKEILNM